MFRVAEEMNPPLPHRTSDGRGPGSWPYHFGLRYPEIRAVTHHLHEPLLVGASHLLGSFAKLGGQSTYIATR